MHFNRRFNINRVLVISIVEYLGSVSDADSTDNIASNPSSSTASREDGLATEPGYVEILGGEEPPDEWLNLGSRRERIDSSSSSSDAGFQYISADRSPSYLQNMDRFTGGNSYEPVSCSHLESFNW